MARPGLDRHPKYRTLCRLLGEPRPHVRGYLEMLWEVAYECGDPVIGSAEAIEAAAEYPGPPGKLFAALLGCGGKRAGFIEKVDGAEDCYQVHDLYDHCPEYVQSRAAREAERNRPRLCVACGGQFRASDPRAKYCSDACRQRGYRDRTGIGAVTEPLQSVTERYATDRNMLRSVTDRYTTPGTHTQYTKNREAGICKTNGKTQPGPSRPKGGAFVTVTTETLRSGAALSAWHRWAADMKNPVIGPSESELLWVFCAAEKALDAGDNPAALFAHIVGHHEWDRINGDQRGRGATRLKEHLARERVARERDEDPGGGSIDFRKLTSEAAKKITQVPKGETDEQCEPPEVRAT